MAPDWPERQDGELLALIQEGRHDAFEVLVHRHTDRFYRLAYRVLANRQAAEDIVQDAFLKLWENPARRRRGPDVKVTGVVPPLGVELGFGPPEEKDPEAARGRGSRAGPGGAGDGAAQARREAPGVQGRSGGLPAPAAGALH